MTEAYGLEEEDWDSLPEPLVLTPAEMLARYDTNLSAPLVRCSKLPFRTLVSLYETHITHTPMILAQEFSRSQTARMSDFSTATDERGVFWMTPRSSSSTNITASPSASSSSSPLSSISRQEYSGQYKTSNIHRKELEEDEFHHSERPRGKRKRLPPTSQPPTKNAELVKGCLVAQFASPTPEHLADAVELISPYVDGIDINCGCPQKWAYAEGIGCALLRKPELVRDMVRCVKGRMGWSWPVSIKIRVDPDLKLTDQLIHTAIQANVSHITIHGRTRHQPSSEPVSLDAIRFAVSCAKGEVPTVANGDLWTLEDARKMRQTGVNGVMGARGLLAK
ncbi:tRNA-dihydrouridine synthase 4 [Tremella mesenterica]|uniref:tRNA-dihydrouridine synthase n=1 Tax=Tremella mesenterica TaxID=5217 RepID=A0A4Q1BFU9_TREME|nr:tRNA-dihydrouridine synthase 4 [Tremella mesenterica]